MGSARAEVSTGRTVRHRLDVAGLDALALRRELDRGGEPHADRFFADIARGVDAAWSVAVGADLALPGIIGHRTAVGRMMSRYVARLHAAAARDAGLAEAFIRVAGLVDSPQHLLRPPIAARVIPRSVRPNKPTRPTAKVG